MDVYYVEFGDIVWDADPPARMIKVTKLSRESATRKKALKLQMEQKEKDTEAFLDGKEKTFAGLLIAMTITERLEREIAPLRAEYECIRGEELSFFVAEDRYAPYSDFPLILEKIPDDFRTKDKMRHKEMSDKDRQDFLRGFHPYT